MTECVHAWAQNISRWWAPRTFRSSSPRYATEQWSERTFGSVFWWSDFFHFNEFSCAYECAWMFPSSNNGVIRSRITLTSNKIKLNSKLLSIHYKQSKQSNSSDNESHAIFEWDNPHRLTHLAAAQPKTVVKHIRKQTPNFKINLQHVPFWSNVHCEFVEMELQHNH